MYRPMSLSHWLQKGRRGSDYNNWIVDARDGRDPASVETGATVITLATDGTWVAFPPGRQPETVPVVRNADEKTAREVWERMVRERRLEQDGRR